MLFFSVTLEGLAPYCHVLAHAEVRDEKGERMSKTKKNGIPFDQAVVGMSADAIRWLYCRQTSHTNINFGYSIADGVKKDFLLILWNTLRFFIEHANSSHWQPSVAVPAAKKLLDRWILSRLNSTIAQVGRSFNQYQTPTATKAIESFVGDLSTWYIRRSRQRLDNQNLLYCLLSTTCQLLAPFVPFIAELIYQNLHPNGHSSVHLQRWPKSETKHINQTLESQIAEVRNICQELHALRQKSAIIIRQPLAAATIKSQTKLTSDLLQIIKDELNIKNIIISDSFSLDTNLTPDLIAEGQCRDLIRKIQVLRKELGLALTDKITITAPSWPKAFQAEILRKTLASSITQADKITITKTN
jgi:isoleucyl-tRNA synthetase